MKYAQKLVCVIVLLLAASLAVGGCVLLYADAADSLARADEQNSAAHTLACAAVENELRTRSAQGETAEGAASSDWVNMLAAWAARLGSTAGCGMALAAPAEEEPLFSTLPPGAAPVELFAALETGQMLARRSGGTVTAFYCSTLWGGYRLLTAYDLTGLYGARTRSLARYLLLEGAVLLVGAAFAVFASRRLTRPLAVLTAASAQIAAGEYGRRTALATGDEVEQLSRSFDAMADAVQRQVTELEDEVRRREDFMAAFTHELKTPMTSIIGYADMLRTVQVEPAEQREAADAVFHEGKRLESLSRKLLSLLALDETPIESGPVPVAALMAELRRAAAPLCRAARVTLRTPACGCTARGDADLLLDLLFNLVQNAVRASRSGQTVEVTCTPRGGRLAFCVIDAGCGIPAEQLPRVTEPFYMVDKSRARRQGSSGLGLALCARIAQAHGGALTLASAPGRGTTVSFTLPQERGNEP